MKTTVELKINDLGEARGTLGWLLKQTLKITIGTCKHESAKACWLEIGGKSELVALDGWTFHPEVGWSAKVGINEVEVDRETLDNYGYETTESTAFDVSFSDAAWGKVEELIQLAREQFRDIIHTLEVSESSEVVAFNLVRA